MADHRLFSSRIRQRYLALDGLAHAYGVLSLAHGGTPSIGDA